MATQEQEFDTVFFVANRYINNFMRNADLCPEYKVFTFAKMVRIKTTSKVDSVYFQNIIEKSKILVDSFWIPAIMHENVLYTSPEIKEISDGHQIIFVTNLTEE